MLGQQGMSGQIEIETTPTTRGKISRREMDVLLQVKDGLRNPEIAANLGLSTKTVENHVRSILQKLGAKNRTEAVVIALKNSIIEI